ncbi:hypothetical protein GGI35DRAFT_93177 [Trichoderma velutinum]
MPNSMAPAMNITMIVCSALSLIFMALRFYSKQLVSTKLGIDDAVLLFAWLLFVTFIVLSIYATQFGLGKHYEDADLLKLPRLLYLLPIGQFFAVISVAVSKSSFILTLLKLVTLTWQKAALWFMLVTINGSMFSIAVVQFFQCSVPPTPGCVQNNVVIGLGSYAAGYSAAMDLVLTAFPAIVIWNLQMKSSDKFGIIASMSLGIVAGVVGIYKTSTIGLVARNADFTYGTAFPLIWLSAEVSATVIAASIPFFRPLVRMIKGTEAKESSYALSKVSRPGTNPLNRTHEQLEDDGRSDQFILKPGSNNILRETTYTVQHSYEGEDKASDTDHSQRGHRDGY